MVRVELCPPTVGSRRRSPRLTSSRSTAGWACPRLGAKPHLFPNRWAGRQEGQKLRRGRRNAPVEVGGHDRVRAGDRTRSTFWVRFRYSWVPSRQYRKLERVRSRLHVHILAVRARGAMVSRLQAALSCCASSVLIYPGCAHESCAASRALKDFE